MSTIKSNNHQVGQSATANQNFTLYQPTVPDGTVRLGVGNSGATTADALTVSNAGNATVLGNLTVSGAGTSTVAGNLTVTGTLNATTALQSGGVTASRIVQGTVVTPSGTTTAFTGLPSWVKRVSIDMSGVTLSGSGSVLLQIGSGSYVTTGYNSIFSYSLVGGATTTNASTSSFQLTFSVGATNVTGRYVLELVGNNIWTCTGNAYFNVTTGTYCAAVGSVALSGALDRAQITWGGSSATAGSINIIYEG